MRSNLKKVIPKGLFPFFRAVDKQLIYCMYCYLAIKRLVCRDKVRQRQTVFQSVPILRTNILFDSSPSYDLASVLDKYDISYKSGRHSIYISDQSDLNKISGALVGRCLPAYGIKLFKSRELSPDGTPYYTSNILAPASTSWSMRAVGNISEKAVVSNLLHGAGVAPRVFDLIALEDENGTRHHAFIVQHVEGPVVHGDEGVRFLGQLKTVFDRFGIAVISISEHCDMRPPYFRDNIIKDQTSTYYVDIQNFTIQDFCKVNQIRGGIEKRYSGDHLSEIIFSETNTSLTKFNKQAIAFQKVLESFLCKEGVKPQKCVFVDACRGLGTALFAILGAHGKWGFLLRLEAVCSDLQSFHHLRGYTRFDCIASEQELLTMLTGYNFFTQEMCIICDSISMNLQTITKWDLYKYLIVVGCHDKPDACNEIVTFGDSIFIRTGQVRIELENECLFLMLYLKEKCITPTNGK